MSSLQERPLKLYLSDYELAAAYDLDDLRKWYVDEQKLIDERDFHYDDWNRLGGINSTLPLTLSWDKGQWDTLPERHRPANFSLETCHQHYNITATIHDWIEANGRGVCWSTEW